MNTPHKHKDAIIAWANGATIEGRKPDSTSGPSKEWTIMNGPGFHPNWEYRVKPVEKRYRLAKLRRGDGSEYLSTTIDQESANYVENNNSFIKWLTDWIVYE